MTKSSGKKSKEPELSEVLKKWLEPRIRPKLADGLSLEQAWEDLVKDIVIKALSPLPLKVFSSAIQRLQELDEAARLALVEKLLTISPNPECAPPDRAERIRNTLLTVLSPQNGPEGSGTFIEVDEDFMNMVRTVLEHSHRDWASARDVLQRFLKDCTSKFNGDRNVFIVFPRLSNIVRDVFQDIHEQKSLNYFYACMQELAAAKGHKLMELVKINIAKEDNAHLDKFLRIVFPKGIPDDPVIKNPNKSDDSNDEPPKHKFSLRPRTRYRPPQQLLRPRWHNQQQMLLRTLLEEPSHMLPRTELIARALSKDAEMSAREGLPRCFTGQTPKNSASACLTTNAEKYFVLVKQTGTQNSWYKLSFIPGDLDDAIVAYNSWMKQLIEHDWPLCFGKTKKSKHGNDTDNYCFGDPDNASASPSKRLPNEPTAFFGASNEKHLRCRRCGPEIKACDMKLPSCTKCKSKGVLCVYPMRAGVHRDNSRLNNAYNTTIKSSPSKYREMPPTTISLRTKSREAVESYEKKVRNKVSSDIEAASQEEILAGLDLTGVPTSLNDIVDVRTSTIPNAGRGLFATRNIPMSTPLGFYFGIPTMEHEFDLYKDNVGKASHYSMRYRHTILDATDEHGEPFTDPNGKIYCPFHFMNEDPFGNMVFLEGNEVNQVICWTKRDIQKGEELFVYYGGEVDRGHWGTKANNGGGGGSGDAEEEEKTEDSDEQEFHDEDSEDESEQETEEELENSEDEEQEQEDEGENEDDDEDEEQEQEQEQETISDKRKMKENDQIVKNSPKRRKTNNNNKSNGKNNSNTPHSYNSSSYVSTNDDDDEVIIKIEEL
ncbi:513_t:CDS:2 [Ambispora gerdemannii]|uniref:513_t:CDS:1 n=1 Tax=Ambispora gerdemannii TaxID=144530 RepID=A0A9N8V171_9GLOM|nr:513_t:CDS:2 [Ambispora gerdemannii]